MKTLNIFITEKLKNKYLIIYFRNKNRQTMYTNDYKGELFKLKPDWYEVYDGNKSNLSEVDSLIEFSGKDSPWYSTMKNSENPKNAPKNATILRKSELEKLKSKYKE